MLTLSMVSHRFHHVLGQKVLTFHLLCPAQAPADLVASAEAVMLGQFDGTACKDPQWEPLLQEVQLGTTKRKKAHK